jgi:AAT family amino acid transporter
MTVEIPVFAALYLGFRFVRGSKTPALLDIDLVTGTYDDSAEDDEDNENINRRERGKLGFLWRMWSWVA